MKILGATDLADFSAYHKSLQAELTAIKDRVRNLIQHWPTDGAFKESALRSVLRRHLPESLFIGTGFIVTEKDCSQQIDILIVDKECPCLFWDGDLVIVTPEAVRAVIEVKTGLNSPSDIENVILSAAQNKTIWKNALFGWKNFLGIYIFESRGNHEEAILSSLMKANQTYSVAIDCVAFGENVIVDFPLKIGNKEFGSWVARQTGGMAAASFVCSLISFFSESSRHSNQHAWEPLMQTNGDLKYLNNGKVQSISVQECLASNTKADKKESDD